MVINPNSSVNSVITIPAHATTPSSNRSGLMGRCSATSGLGINALLLTQSGHASASFHSGKVARLAEEYDPRGSLDSLRLRFKTGL